MSWSRVAVGSVQGTGQLTARSVTVDTASTAANIIFVHVALYGAGPTLAGDLTDSQSNVYTLLTEQEAGGDSNLSIATYYKITPTNHASLVITYTPSATGYPSFVVQAFSQGSAPTFNTSVGTGTNSSGSVQPASIGNANDLVVEGMAFYTVAGNTIDGSFAAVTEQSYLAANGMGIAATWKEVSGAVQPTWTTNAANVVAAQAAAVSGVGGGGGSGKPSNYYAQQARQYRQEQQAREKLIDRAYRETILRKAA